MRASSLRLGLYLASCCATLVACAAHPPKMTGPPRVVEDRRAWIDRSRETPADRVFAGSPHRNLSTRLWYAEIPRNGSACKNRRCALIVLAHGLGGNVDRLTSFARALATSGYIVAAPRFPLTSDDAPGGYGKGYDGIENQPDDLSFVIDAALAAAATPGDPLHGRVDADRIGAIGHSMGGLTVIAATRSVCCTDRRIGAAVLVAPATSARSGRARQPWNEDGPPTLLIAAARDRTFPMKSMQSFYQSIAAPRALVEIEEAHHTNLIENLQSPALLALTARLSIAFFDTQLGGRTDDRAGTLQVGSSPTHHVTTDL